MLNWLIGYIRTFGMTSLSLSSTLRVNLTADGYIARGLMEHQEHHVFGRIDQRVRQSINL